MIKVNNKEVSRRQLTIALKELEKVNMFKKIFYRIVKIDIVLKDEVFDCAQISFDDKYIRWTGINCQFLNLTSDKVYRFYFTDNCCFVSKLYDNKNKAIEIS